MPEHYATPQFTRVVTKTSLLIVAGTTSRVTHLHIFLPATAIHAAMVMQALAHHQVMAATVLAGQLGFGRFVMRFVMVRCDFGAT